MFKHIQQENDSHSANDDIFEPLSDIKRKLVFPDYRSNCFNGLAPGVYIYVSGRTVNRSVINWPITTDEMLTNYYVSFLLSGRDLLTLYAWFCVSQRSRHGSGGGSNGEVGGHKEMVDCLLGSVKRDNIMNSSVAVIDEDFIKGWSTSSVHVSDYYDLPNLVVFQTSKDFEQYNDLKILMKSQLVECSLSRQLVRQVIWYRQSRIIFKDDVFACNYHYECLFVILQYHSYYIIITLLHFYYELILTKMNTTEAVQ